MFCLTQIKHREVRIVERVYAVAKYAPGLQRRLHRHVSELERLCAQVASTLAEMVACSPQVVLWATDALGAVRHKVPTLSGRQWPPDRA